MLGQTTAHEHQEEPISSLRLSPRPITPKLTPQILFLEGFYAGPLNAPDTAEENPEKTRDGGGEIEGLIYE